MTSFMPWNPNSFGGGGNLNTDYGNILSAKANLYGVMPSANSSVFSGFNSSYTYNQNPFNPFNYTNNQTTSQTTNKTTTPKTRAEKLKEHENKKIISLLEKLANSNQLSTDEKQFLKDDINAAKKIKSLEEKNEELTFLYNQYRYEIQEYLMSQSSKEIKINGKTLSENFDNIGYERAGSLSDDGISALHDAIGSLGKSNGNLSSSDIVSDMDSSSSMYSVLDVLSSYNSAYPDKNLMQNLISKYTDSFDKSSIESGMRKPLEKFIMNLTSKLTFEAEKYAEEISDSSARTMFLNRIKDLRNAKIEDEDFTGKFNTLYAITRIIAARTLGCKLAAGYGDLDSETFSDTMFLDQTKSDLKNESLSISVNAAISMFESIPLKSDSSQKTKKLYKDRSIDKREPEDQLKSLTSNGVLSELDEDFSDSEDDECYTIYEETEATSEDGTKHLFVQKDDEFHELLTDKNGELYISEYSVAASQIQDSVIDKKSEIIRQEQETRRKLDECKTKNFSLVASVLGKNNVEETDEKYSYMGLNCHVYKDMSTGLKYLIYKNNVHEITDNGVSEDATTRSSLLLSVSKKGFADGEKIGKEIKNKINGKTDDKEYTIVNEKLEKINKNNVVGFILGYNGNLMSDLDNEGDDDNPIKFENKKKIAKVLLQRAKELGLEDSEEYKNIEKILAEPSYSNNSDTKQCFNKKHLGHFSWGWGLTGTVFTAATLLSAFYGGKNVCKFATSIVNKVFNHNLVTKVKNNGRILGKIGGFISGWSKPAKLILPAFAGGVGIVKTVKSLVESDSELLDKNMESLCKIIKNTEVSMRKREIEYEA